VDVGIGAFVGTAVGGAVVGLTAETDGEDGVADSGAAGCPPHPASKTTSAAGIEKHLRGGLIMSSST
jgi:hypothetical protein